MLRPVQRIACIAILAACGGGGNTPTPDGSPPADGLKADGPPIDAPPEPKPAFVADGFVTGQLAIDDAGIRASFTIGGQPALSFIKLFLTETGASQSCEFVIAPKFVMFDFGSTSTRQFKTVMYDVAGSTVVEDKCHFDDAYVLAEVTKQWGAVEIGFAQARFVEDRPNVDVFYDAVNAFPGQSDTITRAGGGRAFAMAPDGSVDQTMIVEPTPGTLLPGAYVF
jgi:hypothetical protein